MPISDRTQQQGGFYRTNGSSRYLYLPGHRQCCRDSTGRKQGYEDNAITHQVDPEAKDFIGSCIVMPMLMGVVVMFNQVPVDIISDLLC